MVKVVIEDIERSYYDTKTDTIHLRKDYKTNVQEQKIIEHEITHALLKKSWLNILWEYRTVYLGILLILVTYLWGYNFDLQTCYKTVNQLTKIINTPIFPNKNLSLNITFPFNNS